jgi:hypothetical protein
MWHNYIKQVRFQGNNTKLIEYGFPAIVKEVMSQAGGKMDQPGSLKVIGDTYHIVGCKSPEYKCYPPFESRACSTTQDCNYALSQLRWGLQTALELVVGYVFFLCGGRDEKGCFRS